MVTALLIGLAAAAAQPAAAPRQDEGPAIVVTGERIKDLRRALEECLARNCPPSEDVDATLALAEAEFLNGDYEDAEQSIRASVSRNQRHAARYPEPVADLWRSQARVQAHRGLDPQALRSTRNILNTLREGLPREDHRHFTARLELVEIMSRTGDLRGAAEQLRELERTARAAGREDVARVAAMRLLRISYLASGRSGPALRRLEQLAALTDPDRQFEAVSARMFLARVYRQRGDIARSDRLLAGIPRSGDDRRQLLYAPPLDLPEDQSEDSRTSGSTTRRIADNFHNTWLDIGYWIEPSGRVSGLEILRQGSSPDWAGPLLKSIRGRVYAPSGDGTPSYRLERYSYTAPFELVTGSRILARSRRARIEFVDLTTANETGRAPDAGVTPGRN